MPTTRILITAFEPYGPWPVNASQLALQRAREEGPLSGAELRWRIYPVDFAAIRPCVEEDLAAGVDIALHVGQAPGSDAVRLETTGVNRMQQRDEEPGGCQLLAAHGPSHYHSSLPLHEWSEALQSSGLPAVVSNNAGTYLCNAALYWSLHLSAQHNWPTRSAFVHLPLDPQQVDDGQPALDSRRSAAALRRLIELAARG